jgi:transposase-like protein
MCLRSLYQSQRKSSVDFQREVVWSRGRRLKTHLSKADAVEFQQRWRAIKSSWNLEVAQQQFEQLCGRFAKTYPNFMAELRKKRPHHLAFLNYPEAIRRSFSTTNIVKPSMASWKSCGATVVATSIPKTS